MPQIDFGHIPRGHFDWAISNIWRVCGCCVSLNTNLPSSRATDIASQGGAAVDGDPRKRRRLRRPVGCQWVKGWPSSLSIFILISIFGSWLEVPPLIYWNVTELSTNTNIPTYIDIQYIHIYRNLNFVLFLADAGKVHTGRTQRTFYAPLKSEYNKHSYSHIFTHSHTLRHTRSFTLAASAWRLVFMVAKLAAGSHRKKLTTACTQHTTGRQATNARKGTVGNTAWRIQSKPLRNSRNASADVAVTVAVAVRGISQQIVCAFCRRALGSADEFRSRRERIKVNQKISIQ